MASNDYHRAPGAVFIPVLSLFSIILSVTPLVWHLKNYNFPAVCLVGWFLLNNVFNTVNAFIWPTDDVDSWWSGVGLCDIEVKLMVASYVGIPGALLCIFRNLAQVLDTDRTVLVPSRGQRRQKLAIEITFCLVVPAISMITHYVIQKTRYMLYTISGCVNSFDESWVTLVLSFLWPTVICLIAGYYCCLVIYRICKYRKQFGAILSSCESSLSKSRFLRLFCLAFTMLLAILPTQAYVLYVDVELSLPWHQYSWDKIHGPSWNTIIKVATHGQVFFDRWIPIGGGLLLFFFFGFGKDATSMYRFIFLKLGFGRWFPSLSHLGIYGNRCMGSSTSRLSSFGSRAKLMFTWRQFSMPRSTRTDSVSTDPFTSSPADLEKGFRVCSMDNSTNNASLSRFAPLQIWSLFRLNGQGRPSLPNLVSEENTVSTTAWAGHGPRHASEADTYTIPSPVKEGTIKVKQVIRQASASVCPYCGDEIMSENRR